MISRMRAELKFQYVKEDDDACASTDLEVHFVFMFPHVKAPWMIGDKQESPLRSHTHMERERYGY